MEDGVGIRGDRALDDCRIGEISGYAANARIAEVQRRDHIEQDEFTDASRCAARIGQCGLRQKSTGEADAQETGAAGDHDAHDGEPWEGFGGVMITTRCKQLDLKVE